MIALKKETVQRIIDDIIGDCRKWEAEHGVCEGYRVNVGRTISDACVPNFEIERLRIRINTIERIQQGHCAPLVHWSFCKVNTRHIQLRLYDNEWNMHRDRPDVKRTQLYEEMTANHKDGRKFDGDTYERIRTGISIDELGEKTQQQVTAILAIEKMRKWFDGLALEEKANFAKEFPEFVSYEKKED